MSNIRDLIMDEADLGSDEEDDDFDEDTGETRRRTNGAHGHTGDSSDEESEDDEEEERAVRDGFIVDEDEDQEERRRQRGERKKRRREEREEKEAGLDEDDLDLIGEANPELVPRISTEPKFKRLKRGHRQEREERVPRSAGDLFDSEEDELREIQDDRVRLPQDEFEGFIEQDEFEDEPRVDDDIDVSRTVGRGLRAIQDTAGLDEAALDDFRQAFGDGNDYDWALALQEQDEQDDKRMDGDDGDAFPKAIELKDVFEPSQLAERMLTDEDNEIRMTDEPERFQIARKPYKDLVLTEEQFKEESVWISNLIWPHKRLSPDLREPFQKSVAKVLEFMVTDEYEVPFIFQHRKDYLIHAAKVELTPDPNNPGAPTYALNAEKLLNQSDLWDIFDKDLRFRALIDKRSALERTYESLKSVSGVEDKVFEEMLPAAVTMEELQDVQDYFYFQHASRLADLAIAHGHSTNGTHRRPATSKMIFEKVRNGKVYGLVRAYGITADAFAQNAAKREGRRRYTEDAAERPDQMAESDDILDPPEYATGSQCLKAARAMFAEEISLSPRMRKVMRQQYYMNGVIECFRTDKGLRKIDEQHPYYEFKYLRNQQLADIAQRPGLFLKMLRAEEEGLIEVRIRLANADKVKRSLYQEIESDNFSEVADAWNTERRSALDIALIKLDRIMARGVKENLKAECENQVAKRCRDSFLGRLDQAPYKPKGMELGTTPRVLALSNGTGVFGRDPVFWAWVEDDGRVLENGKFTDLSLAIPDRDVADAKDVETFVELVNRRKPDVIGVSGFSPDTMKLFNQLEKIIKEKALKGPEYEDGEDNREDNREVSDRLEVVIVNDEVARLYQTSDRAAMEHPGLAPLTKYCVALAKYLQNPLKEYASLGRDIVSISFDADQRYLPEDVLIKALESSMVDMVNLCGVDINEAVSDSYTANLLPYICGLGPRKAQQLLKAVNLNGGVVMTRAELVGDADQRKLPAVGPRVWNNCASFLSMEYDDAEPESDYLDSTRVHPEDYDLGRKMAADALELDEEDIQAEQQENGVSAVVRKLVKEEAQEKVNDLILEEYAEQLERNFNQRKRATLETIRAELQQPYEELRRNFEDSLPPDDVFTMLTGETRDSLCADMIVPMSIKRVGDEFIMGRLDCGIEADVDAHEIADNLKTSAKQLFAPHQTVQAKVLSLDKKNLKAQMSLLESQLRRAYKREFDHNIDDWDEQQERRDKESMQEKNDVSGRTQRVIKHPLFRGFNAAQAEEYLGSQARGDVVIRPSSKGLDHLAITWKVSDTVYQHIDVLELDKENEFSVGKILKVGGRFTYSDLDELIVNHVKAMARKVDEMMGHEKYQSGSKEQTDQWLSTYLEANPKRSMYAFCINRDYPGYFFLCFKAGQHSQLQHWLVKVMPGAYELQKVQYQDMKALCNGFKLLYENMQKAKRGGR